MTISQAIARLALLQKKYGDIEVVTDCSHCGQCTAPTIIVPGAPMVRLTAREGKS